MPSFAFNAINPNDKHRLARDALVTGVVRRKPIRFYGNGAVVRLNDAYMNEKRQWDQRNFNSKQDGQLMRQYSMGGSSNMYPGQMQSQQMMMYGQQGANRQFNVSFRMF